MCGVRATRPLPLSVGRRPSPAPAGLPFRAGGDQDVRAGRAGQSLRGRIEPDPARPGDAPEVSGPLAPALQDPAHPEPVVVDCTLGLGGHSEDPARRLSHRPADRLDRDRKPSASPANGSPPTATGPPSSTRSTTNSRRPRPARDRRSRASCSTSASHSMQLDRGRPRLRLRPRTPPSTCAWTSPPGWAPPRCSTPPAGELVRILRAYGEEKQAKRIVSAIVREREKEPFSNSARLVELIRDALLPRPPSAPAATPPSGPSRPCASRSTAS